MPEQSEHLTKLKQAVKDDKRVAITYFEADHRYCHRHRIAAYLANEPDFHVPIIHLRSEELGIGTHFWCYSTVAEERKFLTVEK
ncbi:hypothetical protein KDH_12460 [Dictyobacter sp. S3.2.2.5]|uniref:DUF488 domain-containing protein n=1 Tax=Dictyobacter halimunensis TaxID=3026934 RepID=A0ABQ6FL17_9CHLR|nr:hypothetical protein KDH_12460 [Dictyobacter sp. S3.2.2.5]